MTDKLHYWYVNGTVMVVQEEANKTSDVPVSAVVTSTTKNLNQHALKVMTEALEEQIKPVVKADSYLGMVRGFSYMGLMAPDEYNQGSGTALPPITKAPVVPDPMGDSSMAELEKSLKEFQDKLKKLSGEL